MFIRKVLSHNYLYWMNKVFDWVQVSVLSWKALFCKAIPPFCSPGGSKCFKVRFTEVWDYGHKFLCFFPRSYYKNWHWRAFLILRLQNMKSQGTSIPANHASESKVTWFAHLSYLEKSALQESFFSEASSNHYPINRLFLTSQWF